MSSSSGANFRTDDPLEFFRGTYSACHSQLEFAEAASNATPAAKASTGEARRFEVSSRVGSPLMETLRGF